MNMAQSPTMDQLVRIIGAADDKATHHILWLDYQGNVHLSPLPFNLTPVGFAEDNKDVIKLRLETFEQGNGYTGPGAAKDKNWMDRLFRALDKAWKTDDEGYCDEF
jgi:hypothetical protein